MATQDQKFSGKRIHELKIDPLYYARVANGSKNFELRKNDRDFQTGDIVILKEFNPEFDGQKNRQKGFTDSPQLTFEIGYILRGHSIPSDYVVFSLISLGE